MPVATGTLVEPGLPTGLGRAIAAALAAVLVTASIGEAIRTPDTAVPASPPATAPTAAAVTDSLGGLPMAWAANTGQSDPTVRYVAQGMGYAAFLTDTEAVIRLDGAVVRLGFDGSAPSPALTTEKPLAATVSSFAGPDPSKWQQAAATAEVVRYERAWPGIDMTMRGTGSLLEWDLHVAAGADPTVAGMRVTGADRIDDVNGDQANLVIGGSELPLTIPAVWQTRPDGTRVERDARWDLDGTTLRVVPQDWDPDLPGVIDPTLDWSTYLGGGTGGEGGDIARDVRVDPSGTYVMGDTSALDFPTAGGAPAMPLAGEEDVFVAKLDPSGSALQYSTLLGGSGGEIATSLDVDGDGGVYVTGFTQDAAVDYPTTPGAVDTTHNGSWDAFVSKLDPTGSTVEYSSLLGGAGFDGSTDLAVTSDGLAYVVGYATTAATNMPTTAGAYDTTPVSSGQNPFVAVLDTAGANLVYSTFVGGGSVRAIALDSAGQAYLTGIGGPPATPGAYDTTPNGGSDAFVAKLDAAGSTLLYATLLGGSSTDEGTGIEIDASGAAFVTGHSFDGTTDFPTTVGAFDRTHNGGYDVFVTKVDPGGGSVAYSTLLGGSGYDRSGDVAIDGMGAAYVVGHRDGSSGYPTTAGAFDTSYNGGSTDAFVTKVDPTGSALAYSTLLGADGFGAGDQALAIAVEGSGEAVVVGATSAGDVSFPTTPGALDTTHNGYNDAFVTRLNPTGSALVSSTFLGGSAGTGRDGVQDVAVDASGVYLVGTTMSNGFPTTAGALDGSATPGEGEAFVAKLEPDGEALLYSTYLGGSGSDGGTGIAVDAAGNAFVTGSTTNAAVDFPTTSGAFDVTPAGSVDAFIAKLNPSGSALLYGGVLGSGSSDQGTDIAIDASGGAYIVGNTGTVDLPYLEWTSIGTPSDSSHVFAAKVDPTGSDLVYGLTLTGEGVERGEGIAVDAAGAAYVTGTTYSELFPTTPGAFDTTHNGGVEFDGEGYFRLGDTFVSKVIPAGNGLAYSTFLGGGGEDSGAAVVVDSAGNAYVAGTTTDAVQDFPVTTGAYDTTPNGGSDLFVARLDAMGSSLGYSTLLGGSGNDDVTALALDGFGNTYVAGSTADAASDFPTTSGAVDTSHNGGTDGFVAELDGAGGTLVHGTFLGGEANDRIEGLARSASGRVVVGGSTLSAGFPTTAGVVDASNLGGVTAGFVSELDMPAPVPEVASGCTSAVTPSAVIGWYPANPGSPSSLQVACVLANNPGSSQVVPAFTVHDVNVAQWHNGAGRRVRSLGASAAGVSSFQLDTSANGIAGVAGWENRPITGPGISAGTFVKRVNGSGLATLSRPTVGPIAAGATFTLENAQARRLEDASGAAGSTTLTAPSGNFTAADVGLSISGTGIARGTTIASVSSLTQVVLSAPATLTSPVVTLGETLVTTSTRQVTGATTVTSVRIGSAVAGFAASDAGLRVTGVCTNGPEPDYVIPANVYIASPPSGSEAATTGGLAVGQTGCTLTIGDPSATAPLDGEAVAEQLLQLDLHPSLVPGAGACADDQPEGLALVGTWRNPGAFQGTGVSNTQPGSTSGVATKALGQIRFTLGAVGWSAFVIERPAAHPGDPIAASHYDIQLPFLPAATIMCPGTATSPGLGFSLVLEPVTASQSGAAFGKGRPGTNQLRSIRQTASGGYTATAHVTSDTGVTFTPASSFRRLCVYPTGTPNPISFQCGSG